MLFLTGPLFLFKQNSTLLPGTGVIVRQAWISFSKHSLYNKTAYSRSPLLRYGLSPDLVTIIIPCSLGNGYRTFGFMIFIIDEWNFLYYSLYILTEKSLKHFCSIRAWVPVSFFLSLSLFSWFLGAQRPILLTLLPRLLRLAREGALCLHPPLRGCLVPSWETKSCVSF